MEWKGLAARLHSNFCIRCVLTGAWNGRSVNCPGLLLGPACTPSFSVGKVVGGFCELPCQHVGVRGVGSREQKNPAEGLRVLPQDRNLSGSGEDVIVGERKYRGRRLRRSRFFRAGRVVPEFISNTDGRGFGGGYPGWRGFARVEFSSARLQ